MKESHMRQLIVKLLKPLHAISVENGGCHPGTPDVSYAGGWIELKATERWPTRPETVVKLRHPMTQQQKIFHVKRCEAGGSSWVLVTIAGEWLLFDGACAARVLGSGTRQDFYRHAEEMWYSMPTYTQLECHLI